KQAARIFAHYPRIPTNDRGLTPLHVACLYDCDGIVEDLIHNEIQQQAVERREIQQNFTPILVAANKNHPRCVVILFDYLVRHQLGVAQDAFIETLTNRNIFHICAEYSRLEVLQALIAAVNKVDNEHVIKLMHEKLLMSGTADTGETPLHIAAKIGNPKICEELIKLEAICTKKIENKYNVGIDKQSYIFHFLSSVARVTDRASDTVRNMIMKKNHQERSSIHQAVQYGRQDVVKYFLTMKNMNLIDRGKVIKDVDSGMKTSLHLAAEKGYAEIVTLLLECNADINARDVNDSTALHCAATLVASKADKKEEEEEQETVDDDDKKLLKDSSVQVLLTLIKYKANLFACDGFGRNCLEVAIISKNTCFVRALLLKEHDGIWRQLMRNAQFHAPNFKKVCTPMRKFVRFMPELTHKVLDKFLRDIGDENQRRRMICDFEFLEDECSVKRWQRGKPSEEYASCAICVFRLLGGNRAETEEKQEDEYEQQEDQNRRSVLGGFLSQFRGRYRDDNNIKQAYTRDPHELVNNQVLSVITQCAKSYDIVRDHSRIIQHCRLLQHPVCKLLIYAKLQRFSLGLLLVSLGFYSLFLGLYTWAVLKTPQPHWLYAVVGSQWNNSCENVSKALESQKIYPKDRADNSLKYFLYVLLWIHVIKGLMLIIGVYRFKTKVLFYMEVMALLLSFIYLYDEPWQNSVQLKCPAQFQIGAFALFLGWLTLLAYLRSVPIFGIFVVMLEVIVQKFLWFFPMLVILIKPWPYPTLQSDFRRIA
ncbi:unnamed protein product, partial [Didymodactylos carnosus]